MAVGLEGGCRVSTMNEGTPRVFGSLKVWNQIGRESGAEAISLRAAGSDTPAEFSSQWSAAPWRWSGSTPGRRSNKA